jgi:hypothetical protein
LPACWCPRRRAAGDKTFVVDGHVAQTLIVAAQVEGG